MDPTNHSLQSYVYNSPTQSNEIDTSSNFEDTHQSNVESPTFHTEDSTSSNTGFVVSLNRQPYTEGAQLRESLLSQQFQQVTNVSSTTDSTIPASIEKQIETINGVMKLGILTKLRAKKLEINIVQSADRNQGVQDQLCLNYIHAKQGRMISLTHPAKGGLPVLLEREEDFLKDKKIDDPSLLNELSERAHCSMLFVLKIEEKDSYGDAILKLIDADDNEKTSGVFIPTNQFGCAETRANGTIHPNNISYVILPERLKPYQKQLNIDSTKLIFVSSKPMSLPYNIGNQTKAILTINSPDYFEALDELNESEMFTHMLRSKTDQELGQ
ncbi:hypothetical protein DB44_FE00200 [Candidatus Protochlamydia amoebophila]|uniref:Uncharacterized protein n=2 Tax=Candidatus Protochlamydia amoebophila TaxID=362787 RepID=A0A0C1GZG5_9BACT|nr:hypothetical protein DB44_FE00200 [Candidatus Protochlamydia amoebophila]